MTTLDESSVRRRDLDLTHNTHKRQASMPLAGFEPTILASELPPTHALNRAAVSELAYCTKSHAYNETYGFVCNCIRKVVLCYQ
jgi:hypothetical protein